MSVVIFLLLKNIEICNQHPIAPNTFTSITVAVIKRFSVDIVQYQFA